MHELASLHRRLQDCIHKKDLAGGREILKLVKQSGLHSYPLLGTHLIRLFALCGSLQEARQVFNGLPKSNVSAWRAILSVHAKFGHADTTLTLFQQMLQCHVEPGEHTFVAALKACSSSTSLDQGMVIHAHINESGFESNVYVSSTLIDMYVKCHRLSDAQHVFDGLHDRNVVSWTAIIAGHAQHGQGHEALGLFEQMQQQGIEPNYVTYVCVLKACSTLAAFDLGRLCHGQIMEQNHQLTDDESIGNTLIDMYAKCGSLEDARKVFDAVPSRSVVAWTAIIAGYVQVGHDQEVYYLFQQMQQEGIEPGHFTFVSILRACSNIESLDRGKLIHTCIMVSPCEFDLFIGNALVNMYAKCGNLHEARRVFDKLRKRDVVTWSAMIAGYAEQGDGVEVFSLFTQMQKEGIEPDKVMFGSILKACSRIAALEQGRFIHSHMVESGCDLEVFVGSSLVDMYVKCGSTEDAHQVFDKLPKRNVVTWSALIAGYAQLGHGGVALLLFKQMQEDGLVPDDVTFVCILKACSNGISLNQGKILHEQAIQSGGEQNLFVGNSLIDLYIKCGRLEDALEMFDKLPTRHLVAWSAMIAGLAQHGYCHAALRLFQQMRQEGMEADTVTFVCILKACSKMAALEQGKLVHAQIKQRVCEMDRFVGSTLIDMYAKCGSLANAQTVFDRLAKRDVVAWSSIIAGYAENSDYHMALQYFYSMQHAGLKPNDVTYISLLCACSHRGLIDEGCTHFESMKKDHGITPTLDHYNCMVDLFGRAGYLNEAGDILLTMPILPSLVAWMSLLSHCRTHGRVDLGRECFESIVMIDDSHASSYELMSKLFVDVGQFDNADEVQEKRKHAHAWKKVGKAFIEVDNRVHSFLAGGKGHAEIHHICVRLQKVSMRMKDDGYIPLVDLVLQLSFDSEDEDSWSEQSESLAVCVG